MKLYKALVCLIALAGLWAGPAAAVEADKSVKLDDTVVSVRGVDTPADQIPGGVGVVDAREISIDQAISITDVLDRLPGVYKWSDSAWGSAINIRGLGRGSVVFNIDGCRVNTATQMNMQFGSISPMDIERVEVLKGPISALYGSGSIGGVVNVITKFGSFTAEPQWHGLVNGTYTSNPEGFNTYANASYNSPDVWVYGSGSYRDHESYKDGAGDEITNSQYRDYQGKFALGYKWNQANSSRFQVQHLEGEDIGIPGTGVAPMPTAADVTYPRTSRTLVQLTHEYAPKGEVFKSSALNLYYQTIDRRVRIDDFPASLPLKELTPSADHETYGLGWRNIFECEVHTIVAGVDVWNWGLESHRRKILKTGVWFIDEPLPKADYFSGGVYAEDDWLLGGGFKLNLGGRVDYISVHNDEHRKYLTPPNPKAANPVLLEDKTSNDASWNVHAGLTWDFVPDWSMTFLVASAYRVASMEELFSYIELGGGQTKVGNPELDPERSIFLEYGLHYNKSGIKAGASVYANFLRDLITETLVNPTTVTYENVGEARIYGAELSADVALPLGFLAYGNMAYCRGEDTSLDEDLPYIAPLGGLLGLRWDHKCGFWARLEFNWAAAQDEVPEGVETSDAWNTFNARVGYKFKLAHTDHEIMVGADNLLDEDYHNFLATSRGFELKEPGLSLLASYTISF